MDFTFSKPSAIFATLAGSNGAPTYEITTAKNDTTVLRFDGDDTSTVAVITWGSKPFISKAGEIVNVADLLQLVDHTACDYTMNREGVQYTWRGSWRKYRLFKKGDTKPQAELNEGFFGAPRLHVSKNAQGFLDLVVLTALLVYQFRKQQFRRYGETAASVMTIHAGA